MDVISVEVTYPTLHPPALPTPPSTPISATYSDPFPNYQLPSKKGIVGCYDIHELSEDVRLFGISREETRMELLRERKQAARKASRTATCTSLTRAPQCTSKNSSWKTREDSRKLPLRHSAGRNCYVDFSGNFRDAVRAQSVKMAMRISAPVVHPNFDQRIPKTPATLRRQQSRGRKKLISASEPVHIKEGLLVIANGKVVDLRKDIKRSEKLDENERKRLRKEMREHLSIVRSFDDMFKKIDATKMQIEQMKTM